jgi:hypothetical protein
MARKAEKGACVALEVRKGRVAYVAGHYQLPRVSTMSLFSGKLGAEQVLLACCATRLFEQHGFRFTESIELGVARAHTAMVDLQLRQCALRLLPLRHRHASAVCGRRELALCERESTSLLSGIGLRSGKLLAERGDCGLLHGCPLEGTGCGRAHPTQRRAVLLQHEHHCLPVPQHATQAQSAALLPQAKEECVAEKRRSGLACHSRTARCSACCTCSARRGWHCAAQRCNVSLLRLGLLPQPEQRSMPEHMSQRDTPAT